MGVALGHLGVAVSEDLLHFIQGPAAVDQEAGVAVPQIMQAKVRQAGLVAQPGPHLHDRRVRLAGFLVDEHVVVGALSVELAQDC